MGTIFGLICAVTGIYEIWHALQLRRKGLVTLGIVKEVRIVRKIPNIYITFTTSAEKTILFRARGLTLINKPGLYQVGNAVPVLYDPHHPDDAMIHRSDFWWLLPVLLIGIGVFFIVQDFMR
jgi:hypothetical protein